MTIPADSDWRVKYHWHEDSVSCRGMYTLQGSLELHEAYYFQGSGIRLGPIGMHKPKHFEAEERIAWRRPERTRDEGEYLIVILDASETLYRNTCSAILDAERFLYLASTPLWLRLIFMLLKLWVLAHQWLLEAMLPIQVQVMNHTQDYHEYHGQFAFEKWWRWAHPLEKRIPPPWASKLQWKSQAVISRVTQALCYWIGNLLLGMKGQYVQDTLIVIAVKQSRTLPSETKPKT